MLRSIDRRHFAEGADVRPAAVFSLLARHGGGGFPGTPHCPTCLPLLHPWLRLPPPSCCRCPQWAYMDAPQSIGYAATISAPHMHAYALELLLDQLRPGAKVLDVGSGTG